MDEEEYLKSRLDSQIDWYGKKSAINKKYFRLCQVILLVMAMLITLSGTFNGQDFPFVAYLVPFLGASIAVISGLLGLFKFQENWMEYRTVSESLKHEKYLFLTKSEPYHDAKAFGLLVNRVENLISKENTNWSQYMNKEKEK